MKYIKKYWSIILIVVLCIIRFLISYKLPSFYLRNLSYDDMLMINKVKALKAGEYLGIYSSKTLIKGIIYPIFLLLTQKLNTTYSIVLTVLYILATVYLAYSLKKIIKNKACVVIIFAIILFNPLSYSSDVFQRVYRNSLSIIELLFFLGAVINIIGSKKERVVNYIILGITTGAMLLTREDNIWTTIVLAILFVFKLYKDVRIKNILINLIPIFVITIILNTVSYINYKNYNIYTYDEISKTHFKDAYLKILQIKDNEKKDSIAIPKSTFLKLAEVSKVFNFTKEEIEKKYELSGRQNGEIYNGNIVWILRGWINQKNDFKDGKEADEYYLKLSNEIENLFNQGILERELIIPSTHIYMPTINEVKNLPKNLIEAICYTSSYKNVKTFGGIESNERFYYNDEELAYAVTYDNYHNAENIIKINPIGIEIIRNIYKYCTIVFSIVALVIYLKNIKIRDKLNLILHIILLTYLIIICGVTYTHTTAFAAIRYCYLSNIYILQSLFILLNLYRLYIKHKSKYKDLEIKLLESGEPIVNKAISVIIPAYNEEKAIGKTIEEITQIMKQNNIYEGSEIIVVNDGSDDNTKQEAIKTGAIVLDNPHNIGYGYSLKKGIEKAKNETIVITDADLSYPFACVPEMLKIKEKGYDLVVGARTGKYYKESIFKSILRKVMKRFVEYVSGKKIKDVNSGLRVFDKTTVMKYFPRLCDTFSFTTSQTLAYMMNNLFVYYIDIPYNKREGKTKVKLFKDSLRSMRYILEAGIYYNPLKVYTLLSIICILLSVIGFIFSHFANIRAGYILGIGGLLVSIIVFALGLLAVLLKQIMDKK